MKKPISKVRSWGTLYPGVDEPSGIETWDDKSLAKQYYREELAEWDLGKADDKTPKPIFVCMEILVYPVD